MMLRGTHQVLIEKEAMDQAEFGANYFLPYDNRAMFRVLNACLEKKGQQMLGLVPMV